VLLKELKKLASRHQFKKHESIPFNVTTILLPLEIGEKWLQNSLPGTNPNEPRTEVPRFDEVHSFYNFSQHILENTRQSLNKSYIKLATYEKYR
jgi:hypothetical protein